MRGNQNLAEVTLGDITRGFTRYRPFIMTVLAVVLIGVLLPGAERHEATVSRAVDSGAPGLTGTEQLDAVPTGASVADSSTTVARSGARRVAVSPEDARARGLKIDFGPACDLARGRIGVPSIYAPPCVPVFTGDNGGRTYNGVTKDTITLVVYLVKFNPAVQAIAAAGGVEDDDETMKETFSAFADYFNSHFELYGRKVKVEFFKATAEEHDTTAAKSDAIAVAGMKPLASVPTGTTSAVYGEELAARGIMCIDCTILHTQEYYAKHAPYLWDTRSLNLTQEYLLAAEYIGKRLAKRPARWAGEADFQHEQRSFGLIDVYTDQQHLESMQPAVDAFNRELAKYGSKLDVHQSIAYDVSKQQEEARTIIARLKDARVTTVVTTGNPVPMVFLTQEATRQLYFPEWLPIEPLMGKNLVGRVYDPNQWAHAFGPTCNGVALVKAQQEADRVYQWHSGRPPPSKSALYPSYYMMEQLFFTGLHMAGPRLTPQTFRDGLFSYPATGGGPTTPLLGWGRTAWAHDDVSACDDMSEFWWDPSAQGDDEAGHPGRGMYRFVDGGRRFKPGQWPAGEPRVFDPAGSAAIYDEPPPQDKPPAYEHKHYK
jgi:hypothetical protein